MTPLATPAHGFSIFPLYGHLLRREAIRVGVTGLINNPLELYIKLISHLSSPGSPTRCQTSISLHLVDILLQHVFTSASLIVTDMG